MHAGLWFAPFSPMRTEGSPAELERRRRLAVQRAHEGYATEEIADLLGVDPSSVRRWVAAARDRGPQALAARPVPGRPRKLTATQEKIVRRWLAGSPMEQGFPTELWTTPRLARLIEREWGVTLHPDYLTTWLRQRRLTPQKPRRVARERDEAAIAGWLAEDWPRIKKRPAAWAPG
jgi:transposase